MTTGGFTGSWLHDSWYQIVRLCCDYAIIPSFRLNNADLVFFLSTLRRAKLYWFSCLFIKMMFIKLSRLLALILTVYHFATSYNITVIYFFNIYFLKAFIIFIIFIYIPLILLMLHFLNLFSISICLQIIKICLFNKILKSSFLLCQLQLHHWLANRILYQIIWFSYTIDIRIHLIQVL